MPELKSLFREFAIRSSSRFLDAAPSERITISLTQESTTYFPPEDGWIVLHANGTAVQTELFTANLEVLSVNNFGTWGRCYIPVKKSTQCTINVWGLSTATDAACFFIPSLATV